MAPSHQKLLAGFPKGEDLPCWVQAPLLPLRHEPHLLLEPYQPVPEPCNQLPPVTSSDHTEAGSRSPYKPARLADVEALCSAYRIPAWAG